MLRFLFMYLQDGWNSMQLAVLGGHTNIVQELADRFPSSIKFVDQV